MTKNVKKIPHNNDKVDKIITNMRKVKKNIKIITIK